jgi:hypothetical protein
MALSANAATVTVTCVQCPRTQWRIDVTGAIIRHRMLVYCACLLLYSYSPIVISCGNMVGENDSLRFPLSAFASAFSRPCSLGTLHLYALVLITQRY